MHSLCPNQKYHFITSIEYVKFISNEYHRKLTFIPFILKFPNWNPIYISKYCFSPESNIKAFHPIWSVEIANERLLGNQIYDLD